MLKKSMPSMFDNKTSTWPDPEQSIGKECLSIGDLRFWLPIGPALAVYGLLCKDLKDLLDDHKHTLTQGEPKPRNISFSMWMIGAKPKSSNPTIVFSSRSLRQRAVAKALLKDSKLLDDYPGVRIKTMERNPAIYQAGSQEPDTIETTSDSIDNVHNDDSEEEAVYMVDDSRGSCGALIAFGPSRLATMGGTLLINGTHYGISAQHGRYKFLEEPEDAANEDIPLCFDDDSDTEDSDLENLVAITSRESISSFSDDGSSTITFTSTTSTKDGSPGNPIEFSRTTESTLDNDPEVPSPYQPTYSSNPKISNLLPLERNDLDYEIFELGDSPYHNPNKIDLPGSGHPSRRIIPNKVARTVVECPVWAATGTTGCVQGILMSQPHYIKMEGSETFQEMWAVKLDRNTKPGDSGAWVVDSAGQLFGHIVAGDPMLGLAFIIPAYKIFDDIKSRFGEEPLLCPSTSVTQLYSAPNDGKVALQRLLDLIKGKETIARIHLSGLGGHGKTFIARQCLVEEIAKRKEIAEMKLKQDAANWTLPDRIADFLQAMVQELLHNGAEAVYRGNILDTSLILTGTFNQLMPATFNATESSAKPSSFGSTVTSIDAHTYIGCNQEKTCDAIDEDYNGTMDPSTTMTVGSPYVDFTHFDFTVDGHALSTCLSISTDDDIALTSGFIDPLVDDILVVCDAGGGTVDPITYTVSDDLALTSAWLSTRFPTSRDFFTADGFSRSLDNPIPDISVHCRKRKGPAPRCRSLIRGSLRSQTGEPSCCVRCFKGSQFVQETQSVEQQIPHWCRWFLPDIARLQPMRFQTAKAEISAALFRYLLNPEPGIVLIREARMQMQDSHPLDRYGNQRILTRRWVLPDIQRLQPMRVPRLGFDQAVEAESCTTLMACMQMRFAEITAASNKSLDRVYALMSLAGTQMQDPHPLNQDGNQQIPHWFSRRQLLQDTPRLRPMREPVLDSYAERSVLISCQELHCGIFIGCSSSDRSLAIRLRTLDDLRRHENFDWNQIIVHYAGHGLQSLYSGAVPTYDARLSRRRRLNATDLREDSSQSSESRERERENGTPLSMALVVILNGKCSTCPARFKNAQEFYEHLCGSLHARNQT